MVSVPALSHHGRKLEMQTYGAQQSYIGPVFVITTVAFELTPKAWLADKTGATVKLS